MEKDYGKIPKNDQTEIVIRVDDFGGKTGLTIREFVTSERYTGFTKAGTRIPAEHFPKFKEMINSIDLEDMKPAEPQDADASKGQETLDASNAEKPGEASKEEMPDY